MEKENDEYVDEHGDICADDDDGLVELCLEPIYFSKGRLRTKKDIISLLNSSVELDSIIFSNSTENHFEIHGLARILTQYIWINGG